MFNALMRRIWRLCLLGLLAGLAANAQAAAPQITTINGNPLTIRIGSDTSYQILNEQNPGIGQIFPDNAEGTADMGWFIASGGELYAPDFAEHPDGTATGGLAAGLGKPYQALTPVSISGVTGSGTLSDPYRVTVVNDVGATGLRATLQVSYVDGKNYFTSTWTVRNTANTARSFKTFFAGDIYLADDDAGIPYFDTTSSSPGGRNCTEGDQQSNYYVLFLPQTPVNAYAAKGYSEIWQLIGRGQLDNVVRNECIDNGAALQWDRTLQPGASAVIQASTSFGALPDIAQFNVLEIVPSSGRPGQTLDVTLTGIGFFGATSFNIGGDGVTLSNIQLVNTTTATARLTIAEDAESGPRNVNGLQTGDGPFAVLENGFTVLPADTPASGLLQLNAATYTVNEGAGTLTVTVSRVGGSTGAASVRYATTNGSAQAGSDYTAATGTLQWADGDAADKSITIAITDDALIENNETFTIALSNASGATLGERVTATVTIVDNDRESQPGTEGKAKRGGGALGAPLLGGLVLLMALRRGAQRLAAPLAGLGLALALPGTAAASDWYAGVRAGLSNGSVKASSLSNALRKDGYAVNASLDDRTMGGGLYVGYHWLPLADVELGWLRFGQSEARLSGDLNEGKALVRELADELPVGGDMALAALRLQLPIAGPLAFTPRFGAYWWTSKTELRTPQGKFSDRDNGFGFDVGLGFSATIAKRFRVGINGELLRSSGAATQQLYTLQFEADF